ncbi:hypothetical protein BDV96DRAFT_626817 [Lophiotrema nucula]|uniref:Mid2 domain-containing protein n=1 Tax=Lophiotrema nucula TaxID=690887 RepID=A0A6A5ZWA0_9PLEO|nr:hypothetical protein BDV96DRAFT_626817 [Lophiotrema nucula]
MTTTTSTKYLPLTTTFTAPDDCTHLPGGPWMYYNVPTTWWKQGGDLVASCFPPGFPFSSSRVVYSPGICPVGWSSACDNVHTITGSTETIVSCCPRSFECTTTDGQKYGVDDGYGCVSPYSIDTAVWNITSGAAYVSSMYQMHVMIVEATTTTSSPTPSPSSTITPSSNPTLPPSTPSVPTASSTTSSTPTSDTLSKGAIAGIAIGAVVAVAIIALLAYIAWTIRKRHRAAPEPANAPSSSTLQYSDYPTIPQYDAHHYRNVGPTELDGVGQVHELKGQ